ncbi:MAG: circadian clock KaiB family protein [bacterium]
MDDKSIYKLKLFVVGYGSREIAQLIDLQKFLENKLKGRYSLEIIDLLGDPGMAEKYEVFTTPTVVKVSPEPVKRLVGGLSNKNKLLAELSLV